jgi:hypothetical protein
MTSDNERGRDVGPAEKVSETAEVARRRPRTRVFSEAVVAALSDEPRRLRTRVVSEEIVAAIPAEGGADDGAET